MTQVARIQEEKITDTLDQRNYQFTSAVKRRLADLSKISDQSLEWLTMEHYQFSFANRGLLEAAVASTKRLKEQGVTIELQRNCNEESGHAPMYKKGMLQCGTDFDQRKEYAPTTNFLRKLAEMSSGNPSRVLGTLYATETAAIFEHEVFFDICFEICRRRKAQWDGSLIKKFHDIHLVEGIEQGHKDGLGKFVNGAEESVVLEGEEINFGEVYEGGLEAIGVMETWWNAILSEAKIP